MNFYNTFMSLFRKDVDALINDFTKVATKLNARAEALLTEGVQLQNLAQTKIALSARAAKVAGNINGLVA